MAAFSRVALCAALLTTSCFDPGEGVPPPLGRIYFPVGIALNVPPAHGGVAPRNPTRLYLVNSNFDLQFNAGSLQSYDLEHMRELACAADCALQSAGFGACRCAPLNDDPAELPWIPEGPCGELGTKTEAERKNAPGLCREVNPGRPPGGGDSLLVAAVAIGAFATDVIYRERPGAPEGEGRLFIPVRGDSTLHWIDVNPAGELDCGQSGSPATCNDTHRAGDDPEENTRRLRMPAEPFGVDATDKADAILVTQQTTGQVSLFVHNWDAYGPTLEFIQDGLPSRPIAVASIPRPRLADPDDPGRDRSIVSKYQDGFLVTYRNSPEVDVLRYVPDSYAAELNPPLENAPPPEPSTGSSPQRPFLTRSGIAPIRTNSLGFDSRGLVLDAAERKKEESKCALGDTQCLRLAAGTPLGVYVANRTPETLLVARTDTALNSTFSNDLPVFTDSLDLAAGPSRVVLGSIIDRQGKPATRIFVVCFDSHLIFGYDPVSGALDTTIWTGRGPHTFSVDVDKVNAAPKYAFGYVAHFTDSYIGVVDLDQRNSTYGTIVLSVGRPTQPRAQK